MKNKILTQDEKLQALYNLLRIRRVEEAVAKKYSEWKMRCPVHLSIGQEAISVGVSSVLDKKDHVYSNHRSHAHYLSKGGSLKRLIAEFYGKESGCCGGRGGSMHLMDLEVGFIASTPIVGGTVPVAVGDAWAAKLKKEKRTIVVFFGDGCFEEGVVHESLNFAKLHNLSIIFVCENNYYSVYTKLSERQPERMISSIVAAHGITTQQSDGNDVNKVIDCARKAKSNIINGLGPQFIELSTYRWLEHCGPFDDDHLNYRPLGELKKWKDQCPIIKLISEL